MQQLPVIQNKLISSVLFKSTRAVGQSVTHLRNWRSFLFSNIIEKKDESDQSSDSSDHKYCDYFYTVSITHLARPIDLWKSTKTNLSPLLPRTVSHGILTSRSLNRPKLCLCEGLQFASFTHLRVLYCSWAGPQSSDPWPAGKSQAQRSPCPHRLPSHLC